MAESLNQPEGIEDLLLFRLSKIVALGGGIVTRLCEGQFGITRREWAVLAVLARHAEMRWQELAARCELDDARLSRAVSSLVAKGYAKKIAEPSRTVRVSPTDEGLELHSRLFPVTQQLNRDLLQVLDTQAVLDLDEALRVLHDRAETLSQEAPVPKSNRRRGRQV